MKILIEVQGGMLSAVTTDGEQVEVVLKDWDNTGDPALPFEAEVIPTEDLDTLIEGYSQPDDTPEPS
jgi:hypothetical protein